MKPIYIYLEDLTIKLIYLLLCFIINSIYIFWNIEIFIFIECYIYFQKDFPFSHFLITNPLDIINILYLITLYYSVLLLYPLFLSQFIVFISNSLYKYQKWYLLYLFKIYTIIFLPLNLMTHLYLIKNFIIFLFNWNLSKKSNLILLEVNPILLNILSLAMELRNSIIFYISGCFLLFFLLKNSLKVINLYNNFINNKQFAIVLLIAISFFFTSGDILTIILTLLINFIIAETFHFLTCIRLNLKFTKLINAYIKSNSKKFKKN